MIWYNRRMLLNFNELSFNSARGDLVFFNLEIFTDA